MNAIENLLEMCIKVRRRGNPETSPFPKNKDGCKNLEVKKHKRMSAYTQLIMGLQLIIWLRFDFYEPPKLNVFVDYWH